MSMNDINALLHSTIDLETIIKETNHRLPTGLKLGGEPYSLLIAVALLRISKELRQISSELKRMNDISDCRDKLRYSEDNYRFGF